MTLSIFVYEEITTSEAVSIEIILVKVSNCLTFAPKELMGLREALRISIGDHADKLTNEDLSEFGISMLEATAIVLRAKYAKRKALPLEEHKLTNINP